MPVSLTVVVTAPSNAYGTSTPGVLWPSVRTYSTWYWVMVMKLFGVGVFGEADDPGSFSRELEA